MFILFLFLVKSVYYRRYKKVIGTGDDNFPFTKTIGEVAVQMEPHGDTYFRFRIGFGPFNDEVYVNAENRYLMQEVSVAVECEIGVSCTFSQCKVQNELA